MAQDARDAVFHRSDASCKHPVSGVYERGYSPVRRLRVPVMRLTPADTEKLLLAVAGMVARDRLARGVRLNHPETVALLSTWVLERARDGVGVEQLMSDGRSVLRRDQVMEGVAEMLHDVQVEATFPDGRKLVTLHDPIA